MLPTSQVIAERTVLSPGDKAWLTEFVREWHLLADTSFSDLLLWLPDEDDNIFWAAAQIRPTTGPTALEDDVVGEDISYDTESLVTEAYMSGVICETSNNKLQAGIPVDIWAIPVIRRGRVIAVVERHTNQMGVRAPGALEDSYLEVAEVLSNMLWHGRFPTRPPSDPVISPRVGDGLMLLGTDQIVRFASPNALSAFRHLGLVGDLLGERLPEVLTSLPGSLKPIYPELSTPSLEVAGEGSFENDDAAVRLRFLPLTRQDEQDAEPRPVVGLMLCRNITEFRNHERELVTKNATIREIHHRVKNNLQTVAALLRLQARRMHSDEAKSALKDAMSRVQSIATVHEILSQSFDEEVPFDAVADQILAMVGDVAASSGTVETVRDGSFGLVPADVATALSLVMTELCQNAIEHGLCSGNGTVIVRPTQGAGTLTLEVIDDGAGLPEGFDPTATKSLGLGIVTALVTDLGGTFELTSRAGGAGTIARVSLPLTNAKN